MTTPVVGIGARQPHYAELIENAPPLGFLEVHSENFFADGGASLAALQRLRGQYPVSLHGVGLALGSAAGLDAWHLDRLERLVRRIEPVRVSDHACFARAPRESGGPVLHGSDLLPIAFTEASLAILVRNVIQVQERLRRTIAVENLSAYVSYADDTIPEADFLAALVQRSGCSLLLDLNNLMVNALNAGAADPLASCRAFVDALPAGCVAEIHLAGYCETEDIVIDDHGSRVRPAVWQLYRQTIERLGAVPTLIEWDTDLPALEVLQGEAALAQRFVDEVLA
jgi:uncharacterized protein (UPF0276 family)